MLVEFAGGDKDGIGQRARLAGGMAGAGHVDRDLAGAGGDLLHASRNLACRRTLFLDRRGDEDRFGRTLKVTQVATADGLAAAAELVMGAGAEGRPVVLARGLPSAWRDGSARAADLLRPTSEDLFR